MKMSEGFFLIELMITLICATLLMTAFLIFIQSSWMTIRHATQSVTLDIRCAMIREQLRQDIHHAPMAKDHWYEYSEKKLIWLTMDNKTISWQIQLNGFIRKEGNYNPIKKTWSHTSTVHFILSGCEGKFEVQESPIQSSYLKSTINYIIVHTHMHGKSEKMCMRPKGECVVSL